MSQLTLHKLPFTPDNLLGLSAAVLAGVCGSMDGRCVSVRERFPREMKVRLTERDRRTRHVNAKV